jgi:hypothetical protein
MPKKLTFINSLFLKHTMHNTGTEKTKKKKQNNNNKILCYSRNEKKSTRHLCEKRYIRLIVAYYITYPSFSIIYEISHHLMVVKRLKFEFLANL